MSNEHRIVVGIDGSRSAERALRWGADLAARTGRSLMIVYASGAPDARSGDDPLAAAAAFVENDYPNLFTLPVDFPGVPVAGLLRLAQGADLLVVGRRRHEGLLPLRIGRVAHRVLSHATCPTAVVPSGARMHANAIVVGVSDSAGGAAAVRFAFAEAARLGAEVIAVRSCSEVQRRLGSTAILALTASDTWESQERTVLSDCLLPTRRAYPSVPVRPVLTGEPAELVLEREGADALMVVVGCRRADDSHLPRLGPVASWAVRDYDVPVVVVGHPTDRVERSTVGAAYEPARLAAQAARS